MFIADNSIVAFKKDIARMNQIDSTAQALSMATYNQLSSNSGDKDYSLFGRKLEKQVKNLEMIEKVFPGIPVYIESNTGIEKMLPLKDFATSTNGGN